MLILRQYVYSNVSCHYLFNKEESLTYHVYLILQYFTIYYFFFLKIVYDITGYRGLNFAADTHVTDVEEVKSVTQ